MAFKQPLLADFPQYLQGTDRLTVLSEAFGFQLLTRFLWDLGAAILTNYNDRLNLGGKPETGISTRV